jgi:hypothetical protein
MRSDGAILTLDRNTDTSGLGPWTLQVLCVWLRTEPFKLRYQKFCHSSEPAGKYSHVIVCEIPLICIAELEVPAGYLMNAIDNSKQSSTSTLNGRATTLTSRGLHSKASVITGAVFGVVAVILLACLYWASLRRRKEKQDIERGPDCTIHLLQFFSWIS